MVHSVFLCWVFVMFVLSFEVGCRFAGAGGGGYVGWCVCG